MAHGGKAVQDRHGGDLRPKPVDGFTVHPHLLADCHRLGRFALSHVLLHRNAGLPWLILVPEVGAGVTELHELDAAQRRALDEELDAVARFLKQELDAHKINVAAIGNIVPQLHIHVIGRRRDDPCWPGVVWGNLPEGPGWTAARVDAIKAGLFAVRPPAGLRG